MWINPMLSIWLYSTLGAFILFAVLLWKFYSGDQERNK